MPLPTAQLPLLPAADPPPRRKPIPERGSVRRIRLGAFVAWVDQEGVSRLYRDYEGRVWLRGQDYPEPHTVAYDAMMEAAKAR